MDITSELLFMLKAIPASFWGVVVGSFFSIGGVALTNRASDRRLHAQFEHERGLKTKDREMALRKEVYLDAAEAVSAGMNAIGRFVNLDLPNDQVTHAYVEKAPAIAKAHIIAQSNSVQALAKFTDQLNVLFLSLFSQRYELKKEKNKITLLDTQITEFGKERDRILEMIKQYNIEGKNDERRWNVLQGNFEFEQNRINDNIANRNELSSRLYTKQLEFMRECAAHTARLGQLLIPVLSAARAELELPFDEDVYRLIAETAHANQQEAINAFVQKVMPTTY